MKKDGIQILEEIAEGEIEPTGTVKVQIFNERGKIRHEEVKDNFIAKSWKAFAKAALRMQWMAYSYNSTPASGASGVWPSGVMKAALPIFPAQHLACWNQTTAEDAVNEHTPIMPPAGIIAWASRHPYGSAAGTRGAVNVTESITTEYQVRHVFDWLTNQGNGTFQSVGWLPMSLPGFFKASFGIHARRTIVSANMNPATVLANTSPATGMNFSAGYADPVTDKYFFIARRNVNVGGPTGYIRILSVPCAGLKLSAMNSLGTEAALTNQTVTMESDEQIALTSSWTQTTMNSLAVVGRDGTNTIFLYNTGSFDSTANRWGKVGATGAATTYAYRTGATVSNLSGTVLGANIYMSPRTTAEITPHAISTGTAGTPFWLDAAALALCTAMGITTPRIQTMTNDGTDLIVMVGESTTGGNGRFPIFKITTAGVTLQFIGLGPGYTQSPPAMNLESSAAPYAGNYYYLENHLWQPHSTMLMAPGASTLNALDNQAITPFQTTDSYIAYGSSLSTETLANTMFYYDGALYWASGYTGTYTFANNISSSAVQFWMTAYRQGYDLGSRVLLGASTTKLNTETMKITYDITLPGWHD